MARPKKPEAVKKKEGTYRQDRSLPSSLEKYAEVVNVILPPDYLQGYAREYFLNISAVMSSLKVLTASDVFLIESLSIKLEIQKKAYEQLQNEDLIIDLVNSKGAKYKMINPLTTIINSQMADMIKIAAQLGLSPEARTKIGIINSGNPKDPLKDLI